MLCCAIGVAAVATGAIGTGAVGSRRFRRFVHPRPGAQSVLTASVLAVGIMTAAALALEHISRHGVHAGSGDVAILTDPGALPFCRDGTPGDRMIDRPIIEE